MAAINSTESKKDLGQILIHQGLINHDQLTAAQHQAKQSGRQLAQVLLESGLANEEDVARARASQLDIPYARLQDFTVDKSLTYLVDAPTAHRFLILPVCKEADGVVKLFIPAWNAQIAEIVGQISTAHRVKIQPFLAIESHLRAAVEKSFGPPPSNAVMTPKNVHAHSSSRSAVPAVLPPAASPVPQAFQPAPSARSSEGPRASEMFTGNLTTNVPKGGRLPGNQVTDIEDAGIDQPIVIQFVNRILADAIKRRASDIHFEPRRDKLDIRYRIDGTLHNIDSIRREFQSACTSRVKVMADMNIAERRVPQDGRIAVTIDGRNVDMRVSSLPTQYGESVVLRILDKGGVRPSLDQLGFSDYNFRRLDTVIRKPHGIFLATGPTGSGKTTTLYSAIQAIHTPEVNIITVEDPIEYDLEGIRQSNVHEKAGLTFARQLRAILRQDPDIIYVGEIEIRKPREIAFRAALTGHLVFSTLHCNDAAGAITRLLNMDVDPFLVASSVIGVLAQRLVRKVCQDCAMPYSPTEMEFIAFGVDPNSPESRHARYVKGAGCPNCDHTGYKGRYSVQELMVMDDIIRNSVLARTPSNKIRKIAIGQGMAPMRQDAANKIMQGITTFEEAQKKVFIEPDHDEKSDNF